MKKFIVIDTWNGDGYSSDNGTQIKIFDTQAEAKQYAESMALQEIEHQESNEGLTYYSDDNSWSACFTIVALSNRFDVCFSNSLSTISLSLLGISICNWISDLCRWERTLSIVWRPQSERKGDSPEHM